MKTFQSMAIGGCIVAVLVIGLQALPDVQWIVVIAAGVFGLVALVTLAVEAVLPHLEPQPVAQPVAQPVDMVPQPPQPVAESWAQPAQPAQPVVDRWSQPLAQPLAQPVVVDSQPLTTTPQPARKRRPDLVERNTPWMDLIPDEPPAVRHVPWLEKRVAPVVEDDPAELPGIAEPALPLPRRAPTAAEYPLVWDAIKTAGSMNAAILAVYGSKDGKTHQWVRNVATFCSQYETLPIGDGLATSVFHYEMVGTSNMPGMVAARLGLEVDDEQLANLLAGLDQCDDCSAWFYVTGDCPCQQGEVD